MILQNHFILVVYNEGYCQIEGRRGEGNKRMYFPKEYAEELRKISKLMTLDEIHVLYSQKKYTLEKIINKGITYTFEKKAPPESEIIKGIFEKRYTSVSGNRPIKFKLNEQWIMVGSYHWDIIDKIPDNSTVEATVISRQGKKYLFKNLYHIKVV